MPKPSLAAIKTVHALECALDALKERVLESTPTNAVTFTAEEAARLEEAAGYLSSQRDFRATTAQVISVSLMLASFFVGGITAGAVAAALLLLTLGAQERLFDWHYDEAAKLKRNLAPLKGHSQCAEALELAKEYPLCQAYRQAVIRENREFRFLDLVFMEELEVKARNSACDERDRAMCRELHGISA